MVIVKPLGREEKSEGKPKNVAIKLGFRSAIARKLCLFHRKARPLLPAAVETRWQVTAFQEYSDTTTFYYSIRQPAILHTVLHTYS